METTQPTIFGDLLKRHRTAAGLAQEALAERARLSRKAVSALECGERLAPRRDTVRLLADALGLTDAERAAFEAAARPCAASPTDSAPPRDPPCNLPAPPTPLLGREREVARALELLRRDGVRLLTLSGPAGVGKTRLSVDVAAGLRADYADGVFLVSLAPLRDPALVASAITQALGVREQGDRPLHDTLIEHLRDKRLLLLLDNFEHVAQAAPLLAELLAACPTLTLLVTSRAPVHVRGEHTLPVPPLAVPDLAAILPLDTLAALPAVALFVQRAEAVAPDFALTPANAAAVAAICRRLDGLPLAIELAAARVTLLSPEALLARLDHRLPMLVGGARDLPERQQTLHAAIGWSYDLLHAGERALFRRLSVFAGGATLDAVEAVCGAGGELEGDALEWLAALVDKNLLRREEGPSGEPRVGLLETIREYGREQLAANGELEATGRAHTAYYLTLVETAQPEIVGPRQQAWLERLEREHDNLRAALRWASESNEIELGLRLAGVLWRLWYMHGHLDEGRAWLEGLLERKGTVATAVRAEALRGAGVLAVQQGELGSATALCAESLTLYRDLGDIRGIADMLNALANAAREQGDYARAMVLYEDSLARYRALEDTQGIAVALNNLGTAARYHGNLERAATLYQDSLALRRTLGDTQGIAHTLKNLGAVAQARGDVVQAPVWYTEGLTLSRSTGNTWLMAPILEGLAGVARLQGRAEGAARLMGAAATLRKNIGSTLTPVERDGYGRDKDTVRAALGEESFAAAWAEGAALSLEQAVAEALEEGVST